MRTFEEVFAILPTEGWLSEVEARMLWRCCEATEGPILEVGCFKGRSTVLLAEFGRPVYCVDPFSNFHSDDMAGGGIEDAWRSALVQRARDVGHHVTLYRQKIEDWAPLNVDLAYLDGDHTFEGTLAQINKALMCGPLVIAVHDFNDNGGGLQVKLACLERLGEPKHRAERLAVWGPV